MALSIKKYWTKFSTKIGDDPSCPPLKIFCTKKDHSNGMHASPPSLSPPPDAIITSPPPAATAYCSYRAAPPLLTVLRTAARLSTRFSQGF